MIIYISSSTTSHSVKLYIRLLTVVLAAICSIFLCVLIHDKVLLDQK